MKTKLLGLLALLGLSVSSIASAQVYSSVAFDWYGHVGGATSTTPAWADYHALSYCGANTCRVYYRFVGPRYIAVAKDWTGATVGVGDSTWSQIEAERNALFYCRPADPRQLCRVVLSWYAW